MIQVIYAGLAILLGGGLVLFGIGNGSISGGLVDALKGNGGGGGFEKQISRAEQRVTTNPEDRSALLTLARLHFQAANSGTNVDQNTGVYSRDGVTELEQAVSAWEKYLEDEARDAEHGNGPAGRAGYMRSSRTTRPPPRPSESSRSIGPAWGALTQLATYLYYAGKFGQGDQVAARALARRRPAAQGGPGRLNLAK